MKDNYLRSASFILEMGKSMWNYAPIIYKTVCTAGILFLQYVYIIYSILITHKKYLEEF